MMKVKEARIHIQLLRLKGQILEMRCGLPEYETRINYNHDPKTGRFTSGKDIDNITESGIIYTNKQSGKKFGKHCSDWGLDPSVNSDREKNEVYH